MEKLEEIPLAVKSMSDLLRNMPTKEFERASMKYTPKPSDVFVVGAPKTGTTWLQQIVHGLRSGGDMEFEEINAVVKLLEYMSAYGIEDFHAPQKFQPNMLKSHMLYNKVPKGDAKHIIIVRNPADAAVSRYYYLEDWLFKREELTLEVFVDWFYIKPCPPYEVNWNAWEMNFIVQAYPHRNDKGVLWLHYEDLKADLKGCVKIISDFTGIGVGNQELLDLVEHQASFEFMKKHKNKFDTSFLMNKVEKYVDLGSNSDTKAEISKVRKGLPNEGKKEISPEQLQQLDKKWREVVEPICGYAGYEDMRNGINKELQRSF